MISRPADRRFRLAILFSAATMTWLLALTAGAEDPPAKSSAAEVDFFEKKIRPVLSTHCFQCHSERAAELRKLKGGLRLDRRDTALRGGDSGTVIEPGKPADSLLMSALRHEDLKMPPKGRLPDPILADFEKWIRSGAAWPKDRPANPKGASRQHDYRYWRSQHWAWRPIADHSPPSIEDDQWSANAVDRFILARLNQAGLKPSPPADRATLFRRLHYDLLGLPPDFNDLQAFVADGRPDAYERLIDRLLSSPAYGEKWGRHWLDIARYADNGGFNSQTPQLYTDFPYAYTYRDYVIRAFNEDLPFDRFVTDQLAADKLDLGADNRALAALGFLTLGDKSFGTSREDRIDDCIDTVTRGLMAITVSCARCHDHKYDPIPTEDYYSLNGVFRNSNIDVASRLHTRQKSEVLPLLFGTKQEKTEFETALDRATKALTSARKAYYGEAMRHCRTRIADYLLAADGRAEGKRKTGLNDSIIKRWRKFLDNKSGAGQAFLSAWRQFSGLDKDAGEESFEKSLGELSTAAASKAKPDGGSLILEELLASPPRSLADVADAYGRAIARVERSLSRDGKSNDAAEQALVEAVKVKGSPLNLQQTEALKLPIHGGAKKLAGLSDALTRVKLDHPRGVALTDNAKIAASHVFVRGNPQKRGKVAPRRFLALLSADDRQPFKEGSGRLELARRIVDPANPLTARVIVNRIWRLHFGRGLVVSASDFGIRSDPPSHPLLLDFLASRLIEEGWSLKRLHRRLLLSQTYRQVSFDRPDAAKIDQENRLLWRMNRRRLGFESLRDSLLAAAGHLDRAIGGRPVDTWKSDRRTAYGYVNRYRIAAGYMTFDFPSTNRTSPKRSRTLVPQQSLFLMNAPFVEQQASRLIARPEFSRAKTDDQRLQLAYRWTYGRNPSPAEARAAVRFVAGDQAVWRQVAHALFLSNEFIYVD